MVTSALFTIYIDIYIYIFKISLQSKSFNMVGRAPQKRI